MGAWTIQLGSAGCVAFTRETARAEMGPTWLVAAAAAACVLLALVEPSLVPAYGMH